MSDRPGHRLGPLCALVAGLVAAGLTAGPGAAAGTAVDPGSGRALPGLPGVQASAFVVADAGTGQVLAAKDPHGWYRPASTLKVLTAVALIPRLNPDATVVASTRATSAPANAVGLLTGRPYPVSGLFTALLTISANDAAVALTEATGSFGRGMAAINAEHGSCEPMTPWRSSPTAWTPPASTPPPTTWP